MLKIRLARLGAKNRPYYRIVVIPARSPREGQYLDKVGSYNPLLPDNHQDRLKLDADKVKAWLAKGAQPTERVALFLHQMGIVELKQKPNNPVKAKPGKKMLERAKANATTEGDAATA